MIYNIIFVEYSNFNFNNFETINLLKITILNNKETY